MESNVFSGALRSNVIPCLLAALLVAGCTGKTESRPDRIGEAKSLLERGDPRGAIPVLRSLVDEHPDRDLELLLAGALLDTGEAAGAWTIFARLLESERSRVPDENEPASDLAARAAMSLNQLGRHEEARAVLLEALLRRPDDRKALHAMTVALRGSGSATAGRTADALTRRGRELALPDWERERAHAVSDRAATTLALARSSFERDRLGAAYDRINGFLKDPGERIDRRTLRQLLLFKSEVFIRLAAIPGAPERLRTLVAQSRVVAVDLARGRYHYRIGQRDIAERILRSVERASLDGLELDVLRAHRARLLVELGEGLDEVRAFVARPFASAPAGDEDPEVAELANLCRAELALLDGRPDEARQAIGQSAYSLPSGRSWAAALRMVVDPTEGADVSPLIDFPHLIERVRFLSQRSADPSLRELAERATRLFRDRMSIVAPVVTEPPGNLDVATARRLLELYTRHDAHRKAREVAWYVWSRAPDARSGLELARALRRPEEIIERLSVLETALGMDPSDTSLRQLRSSCLAALGIDP